MLGDLSDRDSKLIDQNILNSVDDQNSLNSDQNTFLSLINVQKNKMNHRYTNSMSLSRNVGLFNNTSNKSNTMINFNQELRELNKSISYYKKQNEQFKQQFQ